MSILHEGLAQKEDHQWIFNSTRVDDLTDWPTLGASILDFTSLPPKAYRDERYTLDFLECKSIICDENGDLLLQTNGMAIHYKAIGPPINGDTINFVSGWNNLIWPNENDKWKSQGHRYVQSAGFVPVPGNADCFFVIYHNYTNKANTEYFDLQYGKLILRENGNSEMLFKDKSLNDKISDPGNIHACMHANGRDWWMIQFSKDTVYKYLIDPDGIKLDHIQFLPFELRGGNGQSKFSQAGDKFALYNEAENENHEGMDLLISDFDRCSGELINPIYERTSSLKSTLDAGMEFSPDGNLLYISKPQYIFQIDLSLLPKINIEEVAFFPDEFCDSTMFFRKRFGLLQRSPDNKIYIGRTSQCFDIHVINSPNEKGESCEVLRNAIKLPTYTPGVVPNFNTYRLGPLDGSPCDTLGLDNNPISRFWFEQDSLDFLTAQFWDVSYFRPESWSWTFGDGNSSIEKHPVHSYAQKGIYEVCLTVSNENSSNTSCQNLVFGTSSTEENDQNIEVSLFPNPVENSTRLLLENYLPQDARLILYTSSGHKTSSFKVGGGATILDFNHLNAGIYYYELIDQNKVIKSGKILKL